LSVPKLKNVKRYLQSATEDQARRACLTAKNNFAGVFFFTTLSYGRLFLIMSDGGYKIRNKKEIHFVSFSVVEWVGVFYEQEIFFKDNQ